MSNFEQSHHGCRPYHYAIVRGGLIFASPRLIHERRDRRWCERSLLSLQSSSRKLEENGQSRSSS